MEFFFEKADIYALEYLSSGLLISASKDSSVKIWNVNDSSLIHSLKYHSASVRSLALLGNNLLPSGSTYCQIIDVNVTNGQLIQIIDTVEIVWSLLRLKDDQQLASGLEQSIKIWNISDARYWKH